MFMDLTKSHIEILQALVNLYRSKKRPITSMEIAEYLEKSDGTIRNSMPALKALGLIEAKTGPSGGYIPTVKGMEVLEYFTFGERLWEPLKLFLNGRESKVLVVNLELMNITSPIGTKAVLEVAGRGYTDIRVGDRVCIGPTPFTRLIVGGTVTRVDVKRRQILVDVDSLIAIPRLKASEIMSTNLVKANTKETLRDVAELLLSNNIRALPVVDDNGVLVGLVTSNHVARAFIENDVDATVSDYVDRNVVVASKDADILDLMKTMASHRVGRIIIVDDSNRPIGIVTRTDILVKLTRLYESGEFSK
ncbi:MAG: histidine kinase [Thermoprotei archaeon]|nr:MAG: histidine kinase [Thermoprotei archaeon]